MRWLTAMWYGGCEMEAVKNFLWRLLVAAAAIVLFFTTASCIPDKAPAVPVSGMATEPDTEQDAAEAMPIAHGIYPDLPYEPTNEDLAAMQKTEFIGAGK